MKRIATSPSQAPSGSQPAGQPDCRGLFITGTGTGIGKTYVASLIARELAAAGRRVGVYKPVASGCRACADAGNDGELVSDDAVALWEAAGKPGTLAAVCPQRFAAPVAPHLAARAEGKEIDRSLLRDGLAVWIQSSDIVLVEGAGGLMSPLTDDEYVADLAYDFGWPLVIVSANTLGTIHHSLATLIVAATFREGLAVAGVVLNDPSPDRDASADSNLDELRQRCVAPVLGPVAWRSPKLEPAVDWWELARSP